MRAPSFLIASLALAVSGCPREAPRTPEPAADSCLVARGRADQRTWIDGDHRATVEVAGEPCARVFTLATTAPLRDDRPANPRVVRERPDQPSLSTGNDLFDALYALAITEAGENSVAEIKDGAFSEGRAIDCDCFETGRLWTYVWTRDTAYAADLGLAAIDPARARRSLEFKLSPRRGGGDLQIVQDTGSGGSYPISTDRVAWALGARAALRFLDGAARDRFAGTTFEALANTVEHDRAVVFDPTDGLYRGETSFLDWREQSYAPWTAKDTVYIGMSKALSTNVDHLVAIELAAELGQERGDERAARYRRWATELRRAIAARFYLEGDRMLASFTPAGPRGHDLAAPARRFDLLGLSLAVLEGIGTPEQRRAAIAAYPWLPAGPPVLWPQQPGVQTYHNRGVWPFVTAYAIRAARAVGNDAAVTRGVLSMIRGSALNLSNMENFDALSGSPMAPVVNSQRQLWSVAGYLSMVHDVLFGLEPSAAGIRFRPFLPRAVRERLFPGIETLVLRGFRYRGRRIDVILRLPPGGDGAVYRAGEVRLDGNAIGDRFIEASSLAAHSRIEIDLVAAPTAPASVRLIEAIDDHEAVFGPPAPTVELAEKAGEVSIAIGVEPAVREKVTFNVYRDGDRWKTRLAGTTGVVSDRAEPGRCYSVEAVYRSSGNASQRSAPACAGGGVQVIESAALSSPDGWLRRGANLSASFVAERGGEHWLRLRAANGAGPINTGVTCGVIAVAVTPESGGAPVARGYLLAPHGGVDAWERFLPSSLVRAELKKGERYRITLDTADRRAINMSAFAHFERYTGGAGGAAGPMNRIRVEAIELVRATAAR